MVRIPLSTDAGSRCRLGKSVDDLQRDRCLLWAVDAELTQEGAQMAEALPRPIVAFKFLVNPTSVVVSVSPGAVMLFRTCFFQFLLPRRVLFWPTRPERFARPPRG
jgi:hypothetical protein